VCNFRPYWRCYFPNTQAIIYVVDSSDTDRLVTAKEEFHAILEVIPHSAWGPLICIKQSEILFWPYLFRFNVSCHYLRRNKNIKTFSQMDVMIIHAGCKTVAFFIC